MWVSIYTARQDHRHHTYPFDIEVQQKSYTRFLQQERPPLDREDRGLEAVFRSVFPIADFNGTASLEYAGYEIGVWESEEG